MTKEKILQKFTLDISAIMKDNEVTAHMHEIQPALVAQLIESYSPALANFEELLNKPGDEFEEKDKIILTEMLYAQLKQTLNTDKAVNDFLKDPETLAGSGNSSINRHYGYMLNAINAGERKSTIKTELEQRFQNQFNKDFPFRHGVRVMDQNGNELSENMNQEILSHIFRDGKPIYDKKIGQYNFFTLTDTEQQEFNNQFKEAVGISSQQWQYIQARYNQRSITAASAMLGIPSDSEGMKNILQSSEDPRKETWTIYKNDKSTNLQKLQIESTAYNNEYELNEDGSIWRDQHGNSSPTGEKIPYANISIELDVSSLATEDNKQHLAFPTQIVPESVSVNVLNNPGNHPYPLPTCLKHRTFNNKQLQTMQEISLDQIKKLLDTPGIEDELSAVNIQKLLDSTNGQEKHIDAMCYNKLISLAIKNKIQLNDHQVIPMIENVIALAKDEHTNRDQIRTAAQDKIARILNDQKMNQNKDLTKYLQKYIENEQPRTFTLLKQYIHAMIRGESLQEYQNHKLNLNRATLGSVITSHIKNADNVAKTPDVNAHSRHSKGSCLLSQ